MPPRLLGLKEPRFDARTFKLRDYVAQPLRPATLNWIGPVKSWGMMLNDRIGDCVLAAFGHSIMMWTGRARGRIFTPSDAQIIKAYVDLSGYNPRTGENDNGVDLLSALNYFRNVGVAGHKIYAFAAIEPGDLEMVKYASWEFGGVVCGMALPVIAEAQINAGKPWDAAQGFRGEAAPASWGRHGVPVCAWDDRYGWAVTWDQLQPYTWPFWRGYTEECYAMISMDWISLVSKMAPSGFNLAKLQADIAAL